MPANVQSRPACHPWRDIRNSGARHPCRYDYALVLPRPAHPWPGVHSCPSSARTRRFAPTVVHPARPSVAGRSLLPEQCSGSTLCVFDHSVPAIHGATHSSSFSTGPSIPGRAFAPARAMLGLDATRRPELTHAGDASRGVILNARKRRECRSGSWKYHCVQVTSARRASRRRD